MQASQNQSGITVKTEIHDAGQMFEAANDGANRLLRLAAFWEKLGAEPVAKEAAELAARVSEGRSDFDAQLAPSHRAHRP
jgi:hypothetical protein